MHVRQLSDSKDEFSEEEMLVTPSRVQKPSEFFNSI